MVKIRCAQDETLSIEQLKRMFHPKNHNEHPADQIERLAKLLKYQGIRRPVQISKQSEKVVVGHGMILAADFLGVKELPVSWQDFDDEEQEFAHVQADNAIASWAHLNLESIRVDFKSFDEDFDWDNLGIRSLLSDGMISAPMPQATPLAVTEPAAVAVEPVKLADRFLVPPFSILDQRQGYWQDRKRRWLALGIQSEVGRGANLLKMSDTMLEPDPEKREAMRLAGLKATPGGHSGSPKSNYKSFAKAIGDHEWMKEKGIGDQLPEGGGTSIFDPVLCELAYRWFTPKGAQIVDPFAGGSVRGVVASVLGRSYFGMELRQEQIDANREQAKKICKTPIPHWECGDSREIDKQKIEADFIFSCPPYADLEVYSDDPKDLSTMDYEDFLDAYREIIAKSVGLLKDDRFACFVVSEVREKKGGGFYKNFVPDTIQAFEDAGASFYNEAILVNSVGTLALRAAKTFLASRKLGRTHQNVLVFCKGDPVKATQYCGEVDISMPEAMETEFGEKVVSIGGEL